MKNKEITILFVITIVLIIATIIIAVRINSKTQFIKPEFDKTSVMISDEKIDENLQYAEINVEDGYSVGICNNLILDEDNNIKIYFSSLKDNKVYVKLRVYDKQDNILQETGLIKSGERIEKIKIENIKENKDVIIKIMSYDPDTYYSKGTVALNMKIKTGDK